MSLNNTNKHETDDDDIYFYPDDADTASTNSANSDTFISEEDLGSHSELDDEDDDSSEYDTTNNSTYNRRNNKSQKVTVVSEILSYVKIILCAVAIAFVFKEFIIVNAQVPSGSMNNTINTWDRLIGFRLSYLFQDPQRGDIVIFKFPDDETQNYVKRVIGLPGDVIQISNGQVSVNGELLEEDYLKEAMISDKQEQIYVVPEDCYFMMGDNRNNSADSRYWVNKYVKKNKILAKVIFRYYNGATSRINFGLIK